MQMGDPIDATANDDQGGNSPQENHRHVSLLCQPGESPRLSGLWRERVKPVSGSLLLVPTPHGVTVTGRATRGLRSSRRRGRGRGSRRPGTQCCGCSGGTGRIQRTQGRLSRGGEGHFEAAAGRPAEPSGEHQRRNPRSP